MRNYAVCSTTDNALFQLCYLFDFTLSIFSHQYNSFGESPNQTLHTKCHWDYKSFMTAQANKSVKSLHTAPSCTRTKRFLELLEAFLYPTVLQISVYDSCET